MQDYTNRTFYLQCDYVHPGTRVAIASIGGLGTAGIKFAKSFGGHVTALTRSESKREKAYGVGANEFYACLGNAEVMGNLANKFDVIIDSEYTYFFVMIDFNVK